MKNFIRALTTVFFFKIFLKGIASGKRVEAQIKVNWQRTNIINFDPAERSIECWDWL